MVQAAYQSHLGRDCYFAPRAKLADGIIWLLIIRAGISRTNLLHVSITTVYTLLPEKKTLRKSFSKSIQRIGSHFQFLLAMSTGTHLSCPGVEMIPVKAFRIEPAEESTGLMTVDGEKVDYGPLQAEMFPSLASVMCP